MVEAYGKRVKIHLVHFGGGVSGHIKLVPKFLAVGEGRLQGLHRHLVGRRLRRPLAAGGDREAGRRRRPGASSARTSRGRTSWASTGRSRARRSREELKRMVFVENFENLHTRGGGRASTSRRWRSSCSRSASARVAHGAGAARAGGAGPSDAGFLWIDGAPLTVPVHRRLRARARPTSWSWPRAGGRARCCATASRSGRCALHPRPQDLRPRDRPTGCPTGRSP